MRLKIGATFGLIFLVFFSLAAVTIYNSVRTLLIENANQRLLERAKIIGEKTDVAPTLLPLPEEHERVLIQYVDAGTSKELFHTSGFEQGEPPATMPSVVQSGDERVGWVAVEKTDTGGRIVVALSFTNSMLADDLRKILFVLIAALVASTIISVVTGYFVSGILLKPIRTIISSAQSINAANLTRPLAVAQTGDELEEMGKTINAMLLRIENGWQMQNNFFASASHELRTPLSVLQTEFEVELQNPSINEQTRTVLQGQLKEVQRLSRLVEDFLMLSQIRANMVQLRLEKFDLDDLVIAIAERYQSIFRQSNTFLELQLQEGNDFSIEADKDKITHVVINLIENAVKYATPSSTVRLTLERRSEGRMQLTVINKADGVFTNLDDLKQEFYRGDVLKQGYGLGLWISNKILLAHGYELILTQEGDYFFATALL